MKRLHVQTSLVALGLILATACSAPSPGNVVKRFYFLLSAGQTDAAINECSKELKAFGPKLSAGMEEAAREIKQKGGLRSIEIESEEIDREKAEVAARITFGDRSTKKEHHALVREEGRWRLTASK